MWTLAEGQICVNLLNFDMHMLQGNLGFGEHIGADQRHKVEVDPPRIGKPGH